MYDYVIIHGSYGHPFENWEPWLFNVLTSEGSLINTLSEEDIRNLFDI